MIRKKCRLERSALRGVRFTQAHSRGDQRVAFRMVRDAYVARGWLRPHDDEWRPSAVDDSNTTVLLLWRDDEPIGTVSVVQDSRYGLPIERTFPDHVGALRRPGRRLAEFTSLALAPAYRRSGIGVCLAIEAWRYSRMQLQITDLLSVVDAHIADYYMALFKFQPITPVRCYAGFERHERALEEDPVIGLHQDVVAAVTWAEANRPTCKPHQVDINTLALTAFPARFERFDSATRSRRATTMTEALAW